MFSKRKLIGAALAGVLLVGAVIGCCEEDGEEQTKTTPAPTEAPEADPTPTATPTSEPESTATPTPTPESDPEATPTPTPDPDATPTATPDPDATPTATPDPDATPTPTPSPTPDPDLPVPGSVSSDGPKVEVVSGVTSMMGMTIISGESVGYAWTYEGEATEFVLYVQVGDSTTCLGTTGSDSYELSASMFGQGEVTFWVGSILEDGTAVWGNVSLNAVSGGMGGMPSMGGMGGMTGLTGMEGLEEDMGFHVVPGEALTDTHSSGNYDMSIYGTIEAEVSDEPMSILTMGDDTLAVCRLDGEEFTASLEDNCLTLDGDTQWIMNGYALRTLSKSGIDTLNVDGVELRTNMELSGDVYASLREAGYVSSDFLWLVTPDGIAVNVDGTDYKLVNDTLEEIGG